MSGEVNRQNVRIWGRGTAHDITDYVWDPPKLKFFGALSSVKGYDPFFFAEPTVTALVIRRCLKTVSCHSHNKIWTEISFFNKMGYPCLSLGRLLPISIAWWLLGLDMVER